MRILLQMEQYNFSSGKSGTGAAVPFDKNLLFPGRAWVLKLVATTNMAGEFAVVIEVLLDDIYAFHFIEDEEDDLPMHVSYGNINCLEKFESVSWVF